MRGMSLIYYFTADASIVSAELVGCNTELVKKVFDNLEKKSGRRKGGEEGFFLGGPWGGHFYRIAESSLTI
jgi:hypothetical protein